MNKSDYNMFMMDMAYTVSCNSKDSHRKVGAIIVQGESIIGYGWNGTPSGYWTNNCKHGNGVTRDEVVHAEMNAIAKAAASTVSTKGAIMYTTTLPCVQCAKMIVQCGIERVYYSEDYNKCQKGLTLLDQCDIPLIKLED